MRPSNRSVTRPLAFALVAACGLLTSVVAAQNRAPLEVEAQARDSRPESRAEAHEALDGAVAAAVIGAISTQFGERKIAVKLDDLAVQPLSLRDRTVTGGGRLQIGDDVSWIPFQFDVLYDTHTASVSYPALVLGDATPDQSIALDSIVARELGRRVGAALDSEFSQQPVQLVIDRVTTADAGERYLRVEALGTADFAAEGTTPAQMQALYDRKTGEWLRVDYELGTTSNWADATDPAVASR